MIPAAIRNVFEGTPVSFIIDVRKRVKKVKLKIKPRIMPIGRFLSPLTDPESTIGRIGKIQGDNIVTIPAKNAKSNNSIIINISSDYN